MRYVGYVVLASLLVLTGCELVTYEPAYETCMKDIQVLPYSAHDKHRMCLIYAGIHRQ